MQLCLFKIGKSAGKLLRKTTHFLCYSLKRTSKGKSILRKSFCDLESFFTTVCFGGGVGFFLFTHFNTKSAQYCTFIHHSKVEIKIWVILYQYLHVSKPVEQLEKSVYLTSLLRKLHQEVINAWTIRWIMMCKQHVPVIFYSLLFVQRLQLNQMVNNHRIVKTVWKTLSHLQPIHPHPTPTQKDYLHNTLPPPLCTKDHWRRHKYETRKAFGRDNVSPSSSFWSSTGC